MYVFTFLFSLSLSHIYTHSVRVPLWRRNWPIFSDMFAVITCQPDNTHGWSVPSLRMNMVLGEWCVHITYTYTYMHTQLSAICAFIYGWHTHTHTHTHTHNYPYTCL
jgi:hypothetical protein